MVSDRLDLLLRENAGRLLQKELKRRLSQDGQFPEDCYHFIDLKKSDDIRRISEARFATRSEAQGGDDLIPVGANVRINIDELGEIALKLPENPSVVFIRLRESKKVGLLTMPTWVLCSHWRNLLAIDPDYAVIGENVENLIVFQVIDDRGASVLDVCAWGNEWSDAVKSMVV